jgi:tRNA threonylcarbamoyladenosine biosynthesis protein TsaE
MLIAFDTPIESHSEEETIDLGLKLSGMLRKGDIVLLYGELGTGKTTLIKGIAMGFGCEDDTKSPSFIIHRQMKGMLTLNHIDLYRLKETDAMLYDEIDEILEDETSVTAIEWAERIPFASDPQEARYNHHTCYVIKIELLDNLNRKVIFHKNG